LVSVDDRLVLRLRQRFGLALSVEDGRLLKGVTVRGAR
jgi:hypothetical protein